MKFNRAKKEQLAENYQPQRWAALTIVSASFVMIVLDVSILITGLPKIQHSLGVAFISLSRVQNGHTLA